MKKIDFTYFIVYYYFMGGVYLINAKNTDKYKVGVTRKHRPDDRKKSSQTGNPFELITVHFYETDIPFKVETILHRGWAHKKFIEDDFEKLKGEWFQLTPVDVVVFMNECASIEKNLKFLEENSTFFELDGRV